MKKILSIFVLSVLVSFFGTGSVYAETPKTQATTSSRTLNLYFHTTTGTISTISVNPPYSASQTVNSNGATISIDNYLYIGGIYLGFTVNLSNTSTTKKIQVTCSDANYSYSSTFSGSSVSFQQFIPVPAPETTDVYITITNN